MAIENNKGWAWVVCLGTFTAMFLETGTVKALGLMLPTLREQFSTNTWVIGTTISLVPGLGAVTCPLAGVLTKRYSARYTVMAFGLISAVGFIAASLAPSMDMLLISFVLAGFSIGAETTMIAEMASNFDTHYDVATAIGQIGLSLGVIMMPPITQYWLDVYGWRPTVMLLGGLNLHVVVCGAVLRPLFTRHTTETDDIVNSDVHQTHSSRVADTENISSEKNNTIIANIIHYLDLDVFSNVNYMSLWYLTASMGYYFTGWLIYVVPHGEDIGLPPYQASSLASAGGIGNLVGCIAYPVVNRKLSPKQIMYFMSFIICLALAIDPILSASCSYIGLVLSSAAFGIGKSVTAIGIYVSLSDTFKEDKRTNACLWLICVYSVTTIISGFLSVVTVGAICAISSLLGIARLPCLDHKFFTTPTKELVYNHKRVESYTDRWIYDQSGNYAASFLVLSAVSLQSMGPQLYLDIKYRRKHEQYGPVSLVDSDVKKIP